MSATASARSGGTQLKVCGITRREDLDLCRELGVDAVGLNFWPGSKRGLTPAQAARLLEGFERGSMQVVGVFVEATAPQVAALAAEFRLDAVQLHGDMAPEAYAQQLASSETDWVRVVRGTPALADLDTQGAPAWTILDAAVAGFGGAGAKTDWAWAAQAVRALAPAPVWLAGGITPQNAAQAIAQVQPAGVDVASGVELSPLSGSAPGITQAGHQAGHKDPTKIAALLRICRHSG